MYKRFILDVDGVLNDGKIYWGANGKPFKVFGNYDHDGLKALRPHLDIQFITADKAGYDIAHSRIVDHMNFPLTLVGEKERFDWVLSQGNPATTVYMGDGPHDAAIIKNVGLGIAPAQAWTTTALAADYLTLREGGDGAVMEACVYILNEMGIEHDF